MMSMIKTQAIAAPPNAAPMIKFCPNKTIPASRSMAAKNQKKSTIIATITRGPECDPTAAIGGGPYSDLKTGKTRRRVAQPIAHREARSQRSHVAICAPTEGVAKAVA